MVEELKPYETTLDDMDKKHIDRQVAEKGIEAFLDRQLVYLDCSRVVNGMRMMQTIGFPYQRDVTIFFYALEKCTPDARDFYEEKIRKLHQANLAYEEVNPPVWYGGKKAKDKWDKEHNQNKVPRKRKSKEQTLKGFGKEASASQTLKQKLAGCTGLKFTLKPPKK